MNTIKQVIENYKTKMQEHKDNKPVFPIKDLYIGQIVTLNKRECLGSWPLMYKYYSKPVKQIAIFYHIKDNIYVHLKSGQVLTTLNNAIVGDYAIKNIKPWISLYAPTMRECGHNLNTKFPKAFLLKLETDLNKTYAPNQEINNLFKI